MARILILGCGCRGQALARELVAGGHAVRGTTRDPGRAEAIAGAGAEPYIGDPDEVGSLVYALDGVTVLCHLLGSARGTNEAVAALHGPRLRMLLEKTVDTTVRGVLYEAAGAVPAPVLEGGLGIVREAERTWEIPVAELSAPPEPRPGWLAAARDGVERLLRPGTVPTS